MILDNLINLILWVLNNLLLPIFPTNFPLLNYDGYVLMLEGFENNLTHSFSIINKIFPMELVLTFIIVVIGAEILLFSFKVIMWIINIVRGAGA